MGDYGHDLAFGTFITPLNRRPQDVVGLARLTERAGLELATFQDHPYQRAFLDTWTLMSWVLAQTEKLHVAANVLNLPLRPPAVLARAAASLDLLSGGRFELGLGAGAFWDAIAAMGGPRRSPGESVEALSEAIDIVRALWDGAEPGGAFIRGEHYAVVGAKRGPEPAHDISIWLGAVKPRMLRLIGEKADGWIPGGNVWSGDVRGELDRGNRIIDEAAAAAGRDRREIRRLLNIPGNALQGPPADWSEQLLPLAVEQGVGTFIFWADDPALIEALGREVAPAVRAAVAREREVAGIDVGAVPRGPKVLALRDEGIHYDGLPPGLKPKAVEPGDRLYPKFRSTYMRTGRPGLVLRPASVDEVIESLAFARKQDVPLSVRSGGHGISGRSTNDGGIVIDLGALAEVEVLDRDSGRIRVGAGARWGHVAGALDALGLAISSGDYGDVGVGGLATAGGIGFLVRKYGLTIDHVLAAELVLADGTFQRTDSASHPDLFWAVRGAGGNFGIATAFELEAYPLREVVFAQMLFDAADTAGLLERWGTLIESSRRELTGFLYVFPQSGDSPVARLLSVYAGDDTDAAVEALQPLLQIGPALDVQAQLVPYAAIVAPQDGQQQGGTRHPAVSGGLARHLTAELSALLDEGLRGGVDRWLSIRSVGGAVNDVDPMATAYAHRHQNFSVSSIGLPSRREEFRAYWDGLRKHMDGLYISFETDERPERLLDAFPGETLARLAPLKARYDPDGVFNQNFPISNLSDGRGDGKVVLSPPAEMPQRG